MTEADAGRIVYSFPPIVEVICQVTFAEAVKWSVATPGVLWKALETEYPAEPGTLSGVEASFDSDGDFSVNQQNSHFVYSNERGNRRLVANQQGLSVNGLRPYEEWPNIASRFRRAMDAFRSTVGDFRPASINIRYINRIIIPAGELMVEEYFRLPVVRSHQDNAVIHNFMSRSQSLAPDTLTTTTITFASAPHSVADETAFILDIELTQQINEGSGADDLIQAVEKLHELENREFESSITQKCRELFDGHSS